VYFVHSVGCLWVASSMTKKVVRCLAFFHCHVSLLLLLRRLSLECDSDYDLWWMMEWRMAIESSTCMRGIRYCGSRNANCLQNEIWQILRFWTRYGHLFYFLVESRVVQYDNQPRLCDRLNEHRRYTRLCFIRRIAQVFGHTANIPLSITIFVDGTKNYDTWTYSSSSNVHHTTERSQKHICTYSFQRRYKKNKVNCYTYLLMELSVL
jgi:hypothetical protein